MCFVYAWYRGIGCFEGAIVCKFACFLVAMYVCVSPNFFVLYTLCGNHVTWLTIDVMRSLSRWLCSEDGFLDVVVKHVYVVEVVSKYLDVVLRYFMC